MEKGTVSFSFDYLDILSAIDDDVYVRGIFISEEETSDALEVVKPQECVAIMSRRIFNDAMTEWLDRKKQFYKNYNHFCGVGSFYCDEYHEGETINLLAEDQSEYEKMFMIDEDKAELKYIDARVFRLLLLELDMEHG